MGQARAVRVVNLVAQGTIEEGMLSVLAFKKSVFAGVLDGGDKDVFLGGTKLNKFMETVERVAASIPEATVEEADAAYGAPERDGGRPERPDRPGRRRGPARPMRPVPAPMPAAAASAPAGTDVWTNLLQAGMAVLQQVVQGASGTGGRAGAAAAPAQPSLLERDQVTGQSYLRLPVPPPDVLKQLLQSVGSLLQGMQG
jgi:hypothetical protein